MEYSRPIICTFFVLIICSNDSRPSNWDGTDVAEVGTVSQNGATSNPMAVGVGSSGGFGEISSTLNQAKINELVMQKIQALVTANPELLIHGIPNQLLSQILMQTIKVSVCEVETSSIGYSMYHGCFCLIF